MSKQNKQQRRVCPITSQPLPDDRYISTTAERQLRDELVALPDLLEELEITVVKLDRFNTATAHGNVDSTPLPFREWVSQLQTEARRVLCGLARVCVTIGLADSHKYATTDRAQNALITLWGALNNNLAGSQWAPACAVNVHRITATIKHAIDRPAGLKFHGICRASWEDGAHCDTPLYTRREARVVTCPKCGNTYQAADLHEYYLQEVQAHIATATEIERIFSSLQLPGTVKASTIRKWKQRGQLNPYAEGVNGQTLYRVGDIMRLVGHKNP